MLYSESLLRRWITLRDTPTSIADRLTLHTCEIESVHTREFDELIVIGYVTQTASHPDADKLTVCQVDCGSHGTFQICCGADNIGPDMYVPVALPGAHLASIDLTIAERTLRGVASNGMICAQSELGIPENENTHGIWILTDDMPDIESSQIGNALQDQYPRLANTIYDVENKTITHRPDLMGHAGIARDLYATYMTHQPDAIAQHDTNTWSDYAKTSAEYLSHHETTTSIDIHTATDACSYYSLIELADVDIHTSTFHTRLQLHDLQIAPRSNRVDFSNLFMYQTGQPIHCFDMDKIVGNITVRQAKSDEIFVDLTGKQHALHPDDIVIADQSHILALAGVIGGQDSAITESTTRIAIELATFDPISVRKTAMRHQLRTDASSRYEKYIDPRYSQSCLLALRDMMTMMQADLGNTTRVGVSVSDHIALTPPRIARSETDLHKLTSSTSTEDAYGILSLLGCSHDKTSVTLPRRRSPQDLSIPADITEEVIRIAGYNQLNTAHVTQTMQHASGSPHPDLQSRIEDILTLSYDASSIETYPWISDTWINRFDLDTNYLTHLRNPLQSDHQYLADSHLYNLLDQLTHNHKFFDTLRYYTIGSVWPSTNSQDHAIAPSPINKHTLESRQLGLVLYHTQSPDDILTSHIVTARHIIDQLVGNHTIQPTNHKHFHPRQQGSVMQGDRMLGFVGRIHPLLCESLKLSPSSDVVYLTLDMGALAMIDTKYTPDSGYHTLSDQVLTRDLSLVIPRTQTFAPIIDAITSIDHITDIHTFDLYAGDQLPDTHKSIALQLTIHHPDNQLTTDQINTIMDSAISAAANHGAILRKDFTT